MTLAHKRGDTLIGIIIALGIFVILSQAVVSLTFSAYDLISYARARISARHIALESMEIIRNASYEDVGTVGGIPSGIFAQEQAVSRNGQSYTIRTRINYIDDPFDGLAPTDTLPVDYKRVKIDVSWGGLESPSFSEVSIVSDVSPRGIETIEGGGTLSILVFDADGEPVPQAEVQIVATETNPPVNATYFTSDTGRLILPGAPVCTSCYQITVTKTGMSTDRTYSTSEVENPTRPPVSILEQELTEVSFSIDNFARLDLTSVGSLENGFPTLPNQIIRLRGDKIIGTNALDEPVYKFDLELVTDSQGALSIEELEWDNYHVLLPTDSTNDVQFTNPTSPFPAEPGADIDLVVALTANTPSTLHIAFKDTNNTPVASVAATLKDSIGFEATASSGTSETPNFGQVFFDSLEDKVYTLIATASGLLEHQSDITILGDTRQTIILNPE